MYFNCCLCCQLSVDGSDTEKMLLHDRGATETLSQNVTDLKVNHKSKLKLKSNCMILMSYEMGDSGKLHI